MAKRFPTTCHLTLLLLTVLCTLVTAYYRDALIDWVYVQLDESRRTAFFRIDQKQPLHCRFNIHEHNWLMDPATTKNSAQFVQSMQAKVNRCGLDGAMHRLGMIKRDEKRPFLPRNTNKWVSYEMVVRGRCQDVGYSFAYDEANNTLTGSWGYDSVLTDRKRRCLGHGDGPWGRIRDAFKMKAVCVLQPTHSECPI